jgi:hypothetical protein
MGVQLKPEALSVRGTTDVVVPRPRELPLLVAVMFVVMAAR